MGLKSVGLSTDTLQTRDEVEQQVIDFPDRDQHVPSGAIAQKLNGLDPEGFCELFQVHTDRRLFHIRAGKTLIELAIDRAAIVATERKKKSAPPKIKFDELEMELKEGDEDSLRGLAKKMQKQFGLLPSRLTKFERGLQTLRHSPTTPQANEYVRRLHRSESMRELSAIPLTIQGPVARLAYRYLLGQFEEMLSQEPRAWEGLDPEGVHQMRVATRRTRAAMRAFKSVLPAKRRKRFSREFKWLADTLGNVRDLDVYQKNLQSYKVEIAREDAIHLAEYEDHLARQWRKARARLIKCLSSDRYRGLKKSYTEFLQDGPRRSALDVARTQAIGEAARRKICQQHKLVLRDGRAIDTHSPPETLHHLRIDCKRLRYLFEFFHPIYGRSLDEFIKRLKKLQDGARRSSGRVCGHGAAASLCQSSSHADQAPRQADRFGPADSQPARPGS